MKTKLFILSILTIFTISSLFALDGEVVSVVGKAEIKSGNNWLALSSGDKIAKGAVISTGFKSEAVIKIGNSTFVVQPLSRITIEQLTEQNGDQASQMFLDTGSLKADVKPAENKRVGFTVRSPVATASVRGTAGTFQSNGKLTSSEHQWQVWPTAPDARQASVVPDTPEEAANNDLSEGERSGNSESTLSSPVTEKEDSSAEDSTDETATGSNETPSSALAPQDSPTTDTTPTTTTSSSIYDSFTSAPPTGVKAIAVGEGQSVVISAQGTVTAPQVIAAKEATSTGGTTTTKAAAEATSTSVASAATPTTTAAPVVNKATVIVTVSIQE